VGIGVKAKRHIALWTTVAVMALLLVALVVRSVSAHRAYARAEGFCAATPPGTSARDVTIRALDQSVQVRTDIEPGALVVRFEAWGLSSAVGECRLTLQGDNVSAARVERL
jgi:hypothetical protein